MARLVTDDYDLCPCPCGHGMICERDSYMDHGYGAGSNSIIINCSKCETEWRVDDTDLINRESDSAYNDLRQRMSETRETACALITPIINRFFSDGRFKSRAAELRELNRLGIYRADLRAYRELRRTQSVGVIARTANNRVWLLSQCATEEQRFELERAFQQLDDLSRMAEDAKRQIVRMAIKRQ